ncbi:MAG: hypothetical protein ABR907_03075 [Terracidiphilus sp.]|jgi:hypothetical protein
MDQEPDVIIARRSYFGVCGDDKTPMLQIELGKPIPFRDYPDEFTCSLRIKSKDSEVFQLVHGMDEFQALLLTLGYLKAKLEQFSNSSGTRITWIAGEEEDIGIKLPDL